MVLGASNPLSPVTASGVVTWSGPWIGGIIVNWQAVKIGSIVLLHFDSNTGNLVNALATAISNAFLPVGFVPLRGQEQPYLVEDNGGQAFGTMSWTGGSSFFSASPGPAATNFTNANNGGIIQGYVMYHV